MGTAPEREERDESGTLIPFAVAYRNNFKQDALTAKEEDLHKASRLAASWAVSADRIIHGEMGSSIGIASFNANYFSSPLIRTERNNMYLYVAYVETYFISSAESIPN